jgi:LuxR family transcriptional regulator, maltose regulon positive regulatory protein
MARWQAFIDSAPDASVGPNNSEVAGAARVRRMPRLGVMAEGWSRLGPPGASRERAGRWIRESKFWMPRPRGGAVERGHLLSQLAAGAKSPIVLISASAGYGKSSLAAQWGTRCRRQVAWINVDRGDNNPVVFLNYVAHALDRLAPADPELLDELSSMAPRVDDVVLPALAVELGRSSPFELILDDLHELSEPRSLAALGFLLREIPPGSQVVLVTRVDPELPLARYRVSGDLLEIRAPQLALDSEEIRALVANTGGRLSERSLEFLRERTEGWAAGVTLAIQALDDRTPGEAVVEGIAGQQWQIADYLTEVALARETEERRKFLLATSVLRRMTGSLCDAILGIAGSDDALRGLEQSNSFVIGLDDHRGWYRYHHLFGELLRSELDRLHPGLAAQYLARAAKWYEQQGDDPEEAFRCAHEAGDLETAGRIALASWDVFGSHGQLETIRLWLRECTDDEVASDPQLALAAGWVYLLLGQAEEAQRFALAAGRGDLDVPSADGATSLRSSLANLRSSLAPGGIHQMLADAECVYAAEKVPAPTRWLVGGCRGIGVANVLLGRPEEAITAFQEALLHTKGRPELAYTRILCLAYMAFAGADKGEWSKARAWAQEAKAIVSERHLEGIALSATAFTARAMLLAHDGDFDRAKGELGQARSLEPLVGGTRWAAADLSLRWGNIALELGDRQAAVKHADDARAALSGYPDPGTLPARLARLDERIARAEDLHLTPAELQIAAFLPTHLSLREMADALSLSRATVKTHVAAIYAKLGVSTRSEAVEQLTELRVEPTGRKGA